MIYALGISLENSRLKIALVSKKGKKIDICRMDSFPLENGRPIDPDFLTPFLKYKPLKIISGLTAADVILRDLTVPLISTRKILSVLPFQAESIIPFPSDQSVVHCSIAKKNSKQSRVYLTATKKELIEAHLHNFLSLQINPDIISTAPHSLSRWALRYHKEKSPSGYKKIVFCNGEESFFILLQNEYILSSKLLTFSFNSGDKELQKADEFLSAKFPEAVEELLACPWIFSGDSPKGVEAPQNEDPDNTIRSFALPIGLCLEYLQTDQRSIQWRQCESSTSQGGKIPSKQGVFALGCFMLAALVLGPLGRSVCSYQEKKLLGKAQTYLTKIASDKKKPAENLDDACMRLQKHMFSLKREEKLGTFSPKVTELIAWLGSFVTEENSSHSHSPISITSLHYLLTSSGQVEVDLTLQASPQLAEVFFKKIRQSDSLIDRKKEIICKKENSHDYSAHFYLK